MNFKDAYKSYNEDITGNRETLSAILNGEPAKKKRFDYRPLLACAALVAVVITVSLNGFPAGDRTDGKEPSVYIAADYRTDNAKPQAESAKEEGMQETENDIRQSEMTTDEIGESIQSAVSPYENINDNGSVRSLSDDSLARIYPENNSVSNASGSANVPEPESEAVAEVYGEDAVNDDVDSKAVQYEFFTAKDNAADGIAAYTPGETYPAEVQARTETSEKSAPSATYKAFSGGGSSASEYVEPNVSDTDEYYEYIGINIEKKAKLPEGMCFSGNPDITLEKSGDEITADSILLHAVSKSDPTKTISIFASKTNSFSHNTEATVTGDDVSSNATVLIGDTSVSIDSTGVCVEDIKKLIESLR